MFRALRLPLASLLLAWGTLSAAPVELVPTDFSGALQPQVALSPDGCVHVVFGQGAAVFYTRSTDGRFFTPPTKVGTLEKLALGMRRGPRVTATNRLVLITALSHADGNIHAWTSPDGVRWNEQPALNAVPQSAREGLQALAGDGQGRVALTWLDLRRGQMSLWGRFSKDGGLTWADDCLIYASPNGPICQCCAPSTAFAPDGRMGFLWRNSLAGARDLYLCETKDGLKFSEARKLGQGSWILNACPMDGGALAYDQAGGSLPVWKRIRTVYSSEDSATERKVADAAAQPVATFLGKTPLILWESNGSLMLQRGVATPQVYAPGGQYAAIAGHGNFAVVVFEGPSHGRKTIFFDTLR